MGGPSELGQVDAKIFGCINLRQYVVAQWIHASKGIMGARHMHNITFSGIEAHAPCITPQLQCRQVPLHQDLVCFGAYGAIHEAVVCEQPNLQWHYDIQERRKKLQQTAKDAFGPETHATPEQFFHQDVDIWIIRFALLQILINSDRYNFFHMNRQLSCHNMRNICHNLMTRKW